MRMRKLIKVGALSVGVIAILGVAGTAWVNVASQSLPPSPCLDLAAIGTTETDARAELFAAMDAGQTREQWDALSDKWQDLYSRYATVQVASPRCDDLAALHDKLGRAMYDREDATQLRAEWDQTVAELTQSA